MKIKYFFLSVLACGAFVACTDDNVTTGNSTSDFKGGEAYVRVRIAMPEDASTRATEGGYENGSTEEQAIKKIRFAFYDNDGDFVTAGENIDTEVDLTGQTSGENVEAIADAVLALQLDQDKDFPTQVIAYVNMNVETANQSITNMKATEVTSEVADSENGFMMTNSTYWNDGEKIATAVTPEDFYETAEMAKAADNPVTIYVERLAAKVEVEEDSKLEENITDFTDRKGNTLKFTLEGYALNGTNQSEYVLKNLQDWSSWTSWQWNNASDFRSHWAKDPNYENMTSKPLSYVSYNQVILNDKEPQYCMENTLTYSLYQSDDFEACTHVLVVGEYKVTNNQGDAVGDAQGTFYMYGGTVYDETNLKNLLLSNGMTVYTQTLEGGSTKYTPVLAEGYELVQIEGTNEATLALKQPEEGTTYYVKNGNDYTAIENYTDFNSELEALVGGAEKYNEGKAYFAVPIEHFGTEGADGSIGVVRNHYYKLTIQSITGLGDGVYDPDEDIIPTPGKDRYYVGAVLNVLSWKTVEQSVNL